MSSARVRAVSAAPRPHSSNLSVVQRSASCDRPVVDLLDKLRTNDPQLVDADFSNRLLTYTHLQYLSEVVRSNTHLRCLRLVHCGLEQEDKVRCLAKALADSLSLVTVDLRHNALPPTSIGLFANALRSSVQLRALKFSPPSHDTPDPGPAQMRMKQQFHVAQEVLEPYLKANQALFLLVENRTAVLSLCHRGLTQLAPLLCDLPFLEDFNLSHNRLQSLPPQLQWKKLKHLDLRENAIRGLPADFVELSALEWLDMAHNRMKEIPLQVAMLPALHTLDMSANLLEDLGHLSLHSLCKRTTMKCLRLQNNPFRPDALEVVPKTVLDSYDGQLVLQTLRELAVPKAKRPTAQLFFLDDGGHRSRTVIQGLLLGRKISSSRRRRAFDALYQSNQGRPAHFVEHRWSPSYQASRTREKKQLDFLCLDWPQITPVFQTRLSASALYVLTTAMPITTPSMTTLKRYADNVCTLLGDQVHPQFVLVLLHPHRASATEVDRAVQDMREQLGSVVARRVVPIARRSNGLLFDELVSPLASLLIRLAERLPHMQQRVPDSFQLFEETLKGLVLTNRYKPILECTTVVEMMKQSGVTLSHKETLLRYLHDTGTLLYWNSEFISMPDWVVLDYHVLVDMYYRLILCHSQSNSVLITYQEIHAIWKDYGDATRASVLSVFQRFELLPPTAQPETVLLPFLIPSHTPMAANALPPDYKRPVWRRVYRLRYFASTLYVRLLNSVMELFPKVLMWQGGAIFTRKPDLATVVSHEMGLVRFDFLQATVYLEVPRKWPPYFMQRLTSILEESVAPYRALTYQTLVPCSHCIKASKASALSVHAFSILELAALVESGQHEVLCPTTLPSSSSSSHATSSASPATTASDSPRSPSLSSSSSPSVVGRHKAKEEKQEKQERQERQEKQEREDKEDKENEKTATEKQKQKRQKDKGGKDKKDHQEGKAGNQPPVTMVQIRKLVPSVLLKNLKELHIHEDDLELLEVIGTGTYGRVHKATYRHMTVAVKVLHQIEAEEAMQARLFAEFRREVLFMSELHDPHLVQLRGVASLPDFCVIQEYCPAGDLHQYLRQYYATHQQPPPLSFSLRVAYNLAKGMEYLHSCRPPVLHRDLKSPNVMLMHTVEEVEAARDACELGVLAKITDFGLSSQSHLPFACRIVDNPLWLAPEILDQQPYSEKVDVYSFGIILWELFTCQPPFAEFAIPFTYQLEEQIRRHHLRPTVPLDCDPDCAQLMRQCWDPAPPLRPPFKSICSSLLRTMGAYHISTEVSYTLSDTLSNDIELMNTSESESSSNSDVARPSETLRRRVLEKNSSIINVRRSVSAAEQRP